MKPDQQNHPDEQHRLGWFILIILLILRIPYTIAIIYWLPMENQNGAAVYEVATYFLTVFLIWWERDNLEQFHLDTTAILCIILFRPIQTLILSYWQVDSPLRFPELAALMVWFLAIGLFIILLKSGYKPTPLTTRKWIWLFIGLCVGISFSLVQNLKVVLSALDIPNQTSTNLPFIKSSSLTLLYHLGFAPINEEPLFRGFLWGYLRRQLKWRESVIWIFQTILFMLAHVYRASHDPLLFWVIIPLSGLLFGMLVWRSRSLAPAILAHGLINGSVYLLIIYLIPSLTHWLN
jgi:membrane protease YdiL (CAAX protease family)